MRKKAFIIIVSLLSLFIIEYSGIFRDSAPERENRYVNTTGKSASGDHGTGFFISSSTTAGNPPSPGISRPDSDEGIGKIAPVNDCLHIIIVYCVILIIIKIVVSKKKQKDVQ